MKISYSWPCDVCGQSTSYLEDEESGLTWTQCDHCGWVRESAPVIGPDGQPITGADGRWLTNISYSHPAQANSSLPGDKARVASLHIVPLWDNSSLPGKRGGPAGGSTPPLWAGLKGFKEWIKSKL